MGEERYWDTPEASNSTSAQRMTLVTSVDSEHFESFANWIRGVESLDEEGVRRVPVDSVRIVVIAANVTEYHRFLFYHLEFQQ